LFNLSSKTKLLVFDEAHQASARTYSAMTEVLLHDDAKLLGLSATPGRTYDDPEIDEGLSSIFARQKVTLDVGGYDSPIDYLIAEGYLSKTEFKQIYSTSTKIPDKALKDLQKGGDLSAESLAALTQDELRNLLIVQNVKSLIKEDHTRIIVFANSVEHAKLLSTYMNMRTNISAHYITGMTPSSEREYWVNRFKGSEVEPIVLFNFGVLTTGFDAPKTSAAIISRPTRSLVLYSQMVGRVIRGSKVAGTSEATVLTVIDQNLPGFRDLSEAFTNWEDVWD
jgi:superfamily II DNA or RNA helicase